MNPAIHNARHDFALFLQEMGLTVAGLANVSVKQSRDVSGRLYLAPSEIDGWGVFALCDFPQGAPLCRITHGGKFTVWGRNMNHSPAPNTEPVLHDGQLFFVALDDIRMGDELTVNYRRVGELIDKEGGLYE